MIINSPETHEKALKELSELENKKDKKAFDKLFNLIYEYEETAPELKEFNARFKEN